MMSAFSFIFHGRSRSMLKFEFELKWFEKIKMFFWKRKDFSFSSKADGPKPNFPSEPAQLAPFSIIIFSRGPFRPARFASRVHLA
jgi:hypothetical protein